MIFAPSDPSRRTRASRWFVGALLTGGVVAALAACDASADSSVTVAAAASLATVMKDLERDFERTHPGVDVRVTTAGSATLVQQVVAGAPIDLLITTDGESMALAGDSVGAGSVVATNTPVVLLAPGLESLPPNPRVSVCDEAQPCGRVGAGWLHSSHYAASSYEPNVAAVVQRVVSEEVDAGVAYASDGHSHPELLTLPIEEAVPLRVTAAVTETSAHRALADEFLAYLQSPGAQQLLNEAGFGPP